MFSLEKHVHSEMSPVFIWHTKADDSVPYQNSTMFKEACDKLDVPCYIHLFEKGPHGQCH